MSYYTDLFKRVSLSFLLFLLPISIVLVPSTLYTTYYVLIALGYSTLLGASNTLIINDHAVTFVEACSASVAYLLLGLLILLTKGIPWKTRVTLFFYGAGLIFLVNLFRVVLLLIILAEYGYDYFGAVHLFFWDFVASILVVGIWIFLVRRYRISSIPVISDLQELWKRSKFK